MTVFVNTFLTIAAVFTFFGMIGEKSDADIKRGCTYGFLISMTGLVIINVARVM